MIHNQFIINLSEKAVRFLLKIFNHIWISGVVPPPWKEYVVVPIPKQNKNPHLPEG